MELGELARRALPINVMFIALLVFSYLGIELTNVDASAATYTIIYFSLGIIVMNFVIIYAVYRYRM